MRHSFERGARKRWEQLDDLIRAGAICLVAEAKGEAFGWACVHHGAIAWVYVRDLWGKLRRKGIAKALLLAAGVVPTQPIPCLFWSPMAAEIALFGQYRLVYYPKWRMHESQNNVAPVAALSAR